MKPRQARLAERSRIPGLVAAVALVLIAALSLSLLPGCGKKGALVPAWTRQRVFPPVRVLDLTAQVRRGRVWLGWTEPTKNTDGSVPVRLERYVIDYNVLPIEEEYCLTCPQSFARSLELDPSAPGEALFQAGRVEVPVEDFSPASKYIFRVWALSPEDESGGDSNLETLNWPLEAEES